MALGRGLTASEMGFFTALSPGHLNNSGSSNPVDLSNYSWALLNVVGGSFANTTAKFTALRSATSNGTFATFGVSVGLTAGSGATAVTGFPLQSSAVWYKVAYDFDNTGSLNAVVQLIGMLPRHTPIDQPTGTTAVGNTVIKTVS